MRQKGWAARAYSDEKQVARSTSIVEFLRAHVEPKHGFEDALVLPDEEPGADKVRWGPGSADNMTWRRFGAKDDPEARAKAGAIRDRLLAYAAQPTNERLGDLEAVLDAPAASVVRLFDAVAGSLRIPSRAVVHAGLRQIAETTPRREPLKLALFLLGLVGDPSDDDLLRLVGMHAELTPYAAMAIRRINADPIPYLLDLAPDTGGWGRVTIVEALLDEDAERSRDYLLRHGLAGLWPEVAFEVALRVARECRLLDALRSDDGDLELVRGCGTILNALASSPFDEFRQYADAPSATVEFLRRLEPLASTLHDYQLVLSLRECAGLDAEPGADPTVAPAALWRPEDRTAAEEIAVRILEDPAWRPRVVAGLAEPRLRNVALDIAARLGIDVCDRLVGWLRADPLDAYLWSRLCLETGSAGIDRALDLARDVLDVGQIATGPADALGFGPEWKRHRCVDSLLQALKGGPDGEPWRDPAARGAAGKGEDVILAALRSPVVRNRGLALATLEAWPSALVTLALYSAVEVAARDPVVQVRQQAEGLLGRLRKPRIH